MQKYLHAIRIFADTPMSCPDFRGDHTVCRKASVLQGLRLSERQAAEMASQLLRIISALHAHQLCHGHIGGASLVLTASPPTPIRAPPPSEGVPLEHEQQQQSVPPPPALGNISSLSPPTSGLSTTEESDSESADGMSSWLLPGYPQGVEHQDVRRGNNSKLHQRAPGSPSEALLRASTASMRTPPRRCEGGSVSEATPVGESCDKRHSTRPSHSSSTRRNFAATRNTLSVNETFEGLASASVMSGISSRMVIPIRSMRAEIEQMSAPSGSTASQSVSADMSAASGRPAAPEALGPQTLHSPPTAAGPVCEGAEAGAPLGGTSSISWDAQVSDMIDQQLDMFAPASAALGLMPSVTTEPGMYKAAASAFEVGSDGGGAQPPGGDAGEDEQMNTRWSFEADVGPGAHEEEAARLFGEDPEKKERPPLTPVRTSGKKPPRTAPGMGQVQSSIERRQLFDAAMEAGAEKFDGAYGTRKPTGGCTQCEEMGQVCADCRLRGVNQRIARGRERRVQPGPADAGKRRSRKAGGATAADARREGARPVSAESGVHVMLHLHGVGDMPAVGGARLFAIHKDISAAGAALLLALTGEDADVYHLQRALETRRPVSRQLAWTMMSAEARDFIEGLLGERLSLEGAYQVCIPLCTCIPPAS